MFRYLISACLFLCLSLPASYAQEQTVNETKTTPSDSIADVSPTTIDRINQLQQMIKNDIDHLSTLEGEFKTFTEYRIKNKTVELREIIAQLMEQNPRPDALLVKLVQDQLSFLQKAGDYLDEEIKRLRGQLAKSDNDDQIILDISKRESDRDYYLKAEFTTIERAKTLGLESNQQERLVEKLLLRADYFESLVTYTQMQLKHAVDEASLAGTDITAEQKSRVLTLKERLNQNITSLEIVAELLDKLNQNTAKIKQTLFNVSGDITQDVLNISVASSLLAEWINIGSAAVVENGPSLTFKTLVFCFILFLTSLAANIARRVVTKAVSASKLQFSQLLQKFFISLSSKAVYVLGLLIALSQLGIELQPLLAGFGIAGVIIGFALQDTLSNFASGIMILIYRPFDVGDLINAAGVTGRVSHMSLVSTTIKTLDNQRLIIPNNKIWGDTINNITAEHQRRVDMVFGISYSDNIEHAETILHDIVLNHPKVQKYPEPIIKLHTLGDSSVDFIVRPWAKPEDYWDVYWDITRSVKMRFDNEGISIPFPQRDVHIYQK